ncbi:MAG: hypothetical protein HY901_27885, partial [Deltaproteobacteria bacterium]|nr:hypothetical protein [Deltaproteobacteria bacterium]
FTPSGAAAGTGKVSATHSGATVATRVTVKIDQVQDGAPEPDDSSFGPGGYAGVGGEGPGPAVSPNVRAALEGIPQAEPSLQMLYPYDQTVWPLDQLAPLVQWTASASLLSSAEGIRIRLLTGDFVYEGLFGRPYRLASGAPFQRHPIPQEAWAAATKTAAGGTLRLELTLASGGRALGPLTQTWKVANGSLKGVVYYQSYGTDLALNYEGAKGGDGRFGGATLAIKPGKTDPTLVAGRTGGHDSCRVCHSVSGDGSRMVVQHGEDYEVSSSYDLKQGYRESPYSSSSDFKFVGIYPDGTVGLTSSVAPPVHSEGPARLYDMATGTVLPSPGLAAFVTRAGFPSFSPDGKQVAFNFYEGPGDAATGPGDGSRLVAMSFELATATFASPKTIHRSTPSTPPAWPSFLPTNDAVVFGVILPGNYSHELFATRYGGRSELWWTDLATGTARRLDTLNGKPGGTQAIPTSGSHPDDSVVNYEPTVCPLPAGGYAWVVFMSRRLYGNVATIPPWNSDPRDHDHTVSPTTKKLWVAAIDLNAPPGTDPSHPAFYLPAQELFAGNTRGFWVFDPCRDDGSPCESGDQCCGGYCQLSETGGICTSNSQGCAREYDRCSEDSDCCAGLQCLNRACVVVGPN